jgi:hypothetical protein
MTSLKQIEANRLNALKSTGPRTEHGKQRSRQNALRHGLTAETVITALENAADYQAFEASIVSDYQPHSATLVALAVAPIDEYRDGPLSNSGRADPATQCRHCASQNRPAARLV